MKKRNLLFTFDHELYLGRQSGTFAKCMLEPTEALIELFDKYKIRTVFFVDTTCLLACSKNPALQHELDLVFRQLQDLNKRGHYVFPHLHPHWLDARFIESTRQFSFTDFKNYSLNSLLPEKVSELFTGSLNLLRAHQIDHHQWGYRAGGWCIQPFERYTRILEENNIRFDFSVAPGYQNEDPNMHFDFFAATEKTPYTTSVDILKKDITGKFAEYPISTISLNGRTRIASNILRKYMWKTGDRGWGDGLSAQGGSLRPATPMSEMISMDLLDTAKLSAYKRYVDNNSYMHWISHPKMLTRNALRTTQKFLEFVTKNYTIESDFKAFPINAN